MTMIMIQLRHLERASHETCRMWILEDSQAQHPPFRGLSMLAGSMAQQRPGRQSDHQSDRESEAPWRSYDTRSSPFIDLGSPFTLW